MKNIYNIMKEKMIIFLILKTLHSLKSKSILLLLVKCIAITALLLVAFVASVKIFLSGFELISIGWLDWIFDYLINAGASIFAWFLFPLILPLATIFIKETIITSVEKSEYPDSIGNKSRPLYQEILYEVKFLAKAIFLNLLCLPLYLIPVVNVFVYYSLNSYLLGKEFFEMVARKHLDNKKVSALWKNNRFKIITIGLPIILISNIPIINLIIPILATIVMVHAFHMFGESKC